MLTKLKEYKIKAGDKDWCPKEFPKLWYVRRGGKFVFEFSFDESCAYDWKGDQDQKDWNKIGGLTRKLLKRHDNSIMAAWRYNQAKDKVEITIYSHVDGKRKVGDKHGEVMLNVDYGEIGRVIFEVTGHVILASVKNENNTITRKVSHRFPRRWRWAWRLGSWFGGEDNSPGPYGGVPDHDMKMWIGLRKL